jgi:hypothetical protein
MIPIQEFIPGAGYPNLKKIWMSYGVAFILFQAPVLLIRCALVMHLVAALFVFVMLAVILITDRSPVRVTMSSLDGTFTYLTVDCFGKERGTIVTLLSAKVSYKYTRISKNRKGYRLRLYNNYFTNRITLKEGLDNTAFSVEQLDEMVALINKYREVPV